VALLTLIFIIWWSTHILVICVTPLKLLIMQLTTTNEIVQCQKGIMICFCCFVEKLGMAFNMRHLCLRTPNALSMILRKGECKKLNSLCFSFGGRPWQLWNSDIWCTVPLKGARYSSVWITRAHKGDIYLKRNKMYHCKT
jgi:hypothetical protein